MDCSRPPLVLLLGLLALLLCPPLEVLAADGGEDEGEEDAGGEDEDGEDESGDEDEGDAPGAGEDEGGESAEAATEPRPEVEAKVRVWDRRRAATGEELTHRSPAAALIIDLDASALPPKASVADLLDDVAGVDVRRFGGPGDAAYVRVRGSTARQVEVYVDGVPLNAFGSVPVDLSELDLDAFDRVEIYRGVAPPELGSSAVGGVVHLRTRDGAVAPPRMELGLGSWRTRSLRAQGSVSEPTADGGHAAARLSVAYDGSQGNYPYFNHNGTLYNASDDRTEERSNNRFDQFDATAQLRWGRGPLELVVRERLLWRDAGVPGSSHDRTLQAAFGLLDNSVAAHAVLRPHPRLQLVGDLGWRLRREHYKDRLGEVGIGTQESRDLYHQPTASFRAEWQALPWLRLLPALGLVVDTYSPTSLLGGEVHDGTRLRFASRVNLAADLSLWNGRLSIVPAVGLYLLDNRALGTVPFAEAPIVSDGEELATAALPRLALALRPLPAVTLRAAVARGFRPPSFIELFGDRGQVVGNALLRPESAWTLDWGVRLRGQPHRAFGGSVELGGFFVDTADAITFVPNAQRTAVPINLGRTEIGGAEVAGSARIWNHFEASFSATWLASSIREGEAGTLGNRVPNVPEWQIHAGLDAFWDPWFRVGWRFDYTAGSFDSPSNFFEQADRPLHSLHLRVQPGHRLPWIGVEVHNLLDTITAEQLRDPLHPDPGDTATVALEDFRGNPLPGRAVYVTMGWSPPHGGSSARTVDPETEESTR